MDEKGLTMSHPPRLVPQAAVGILVGGASTNRTKGTTRAEVKPEVAFGEHSFNIVKRCDPCRLDYCKSSVTQAQLDELRVHLKIPLAIMMVSREDKTTQGG